MNCIVIFNISTILEATQATQAHLQIVSFSEGASLNYILLRTSFAKLCDLPEPSF